MKQVLTIMLCLFILSPIFSYGFTMDNQKFISVGRGKHSVYVFVSPNCPHCRDLIKKIISEKLYKSYNTTFYIGLLSDKNTLNNAFCSKDKESFLMNVANQKNINTVNTCNVDINSIVNYYNSIIKSVNLRGVPYIFNNKCAFYGWDEKEFLKKCI